MKVTPDDYGRRCQFDHLCKLVLYHEAVDYFRERKRQRGWETSFETLPLSELDTLCTIDQYPSDSFIFPAFTLDLGGGKALAAFHNDLNILEAAAQLAAAKVKGKGRKYKTVAGVLIYRA